MDNRYYVLDLETTVNNKGDEAIGKFAANPHASCNKIVCCALIPEGEEPRIIMEDGIVDPPPDDLGLLIGHNLGFDMQYLLYSSKAWRDWFYSPESKIWDTMIAQYIISGQEHKFITLNEVSMRHAGATEKDIHFYRNMKSMAAKDPNTISPDYPAQVLAFKEKWEHVLKDDAIAEYWSNGYRTEDIPKDELHEYAKYDVINTENVFLSQLQQAEQQHQIDLIMAMMEARMATIDMEFVGIKFDSHGAREELHKVRKQLDTCYVDISNCIYALLPFIPRDALPMPTSNAQLARVVFGGSHKVKRDTPMTDDDGVVLRYKTGKRKGEVKTKKVLVDYDIPSNVPPDVQDDYAVLMKNGAWKFDDEVVKAVLARIRKLSEYRGMSHMLQTLLEARRLSKDLSGFYMPFINLTYPDGKLHPNFQHTSTDTGRLSCTSPNVQQLTSRHSEADSGKGT